MFLSLFGSAMVEVDTSYWNNNNVSFWFAVNTTYRNAKITNLSSLENSAHLISGIRVVTDNGTSSRHIEIYYNSDKQNSIHITALSGLHPEIVVTRNFETAPEGSTVLTSLSL